jgi:hypothetical protein
MIFPRRGAAWRGRAGRGTAGRGNNPGRRASAHNFSQQNMKTPNESYTDYMLGISPGTVDFPLGDGPRKADTVTHAANKLRNARDQLQRRPARGSWSIRSKPIRGGKTLSVIRFA